LDQIFSKVRIKTTIATILMVKNKPYAIVLSIFASQKQDGIQAVLF
jgi:hypothetical protein